MKTTRVLMMGFTLCGATMFLTSCGGSDGEGDDHATQNETSIDTDETMGGDGTMEDDISEDTTMMGDTTTTM